MGKHDHDDEHQIQGMGYLCQIMVLPEAIFVFVSCLFFCFHDSPVLLWSAVGTLAAIALVLTVRGAVRWPATTFLAGLWCFLSVASATTLGVYVNSGYMDRYRELHLGARATDVDPAMPNATAAEASALTFANGTFVDDRRTVGFVADGDIHCVAPVARRGAPSSQVIYWAVGIGCCERRSNFDCGTARWPGRLAGVSYRREADGRFLDAIELASSVYGVRMRGEPKLVSFMTSYVHVEEHLWGQAFLLVVTATLVHVICSIVIGFGARGSKEKDSEPRSPEEALAEWAANDCPPKELHGALEREQVCCCMGPRWRYCSHSPTDEQLEIEAWERRNLPGEEEDTKFFDEVFIAEDGGFSEIRELVDGYRPQEGNVVLNASNWFALVTPVCIIYNTVYICKTDISYLRTASAGSTGPDWCITGFVMDRVLAYCMELMGIQCNVHVPAQIVVAIFELCVLLEKYSFLVYLSVEAYATSEARRRWANAAKIYWKVLPQLATLSAMQLMGFAVPSIMKFQLMPKLQHFISSRKKGYAYEFGVLLSLIYFFASRMVFAVTGLDAFLVKYRITSTYIGAESLSLTNLLGALGFVLQLVGIVDLSYWIRHRLFDFVFGKADGKLSPLEKAEKRIYNDMLAREIWRCSGDSLFAFSVVMLNFSDTDFQKLVLNEYSRQAEGHSNA